MSTNPRLGDEIKDEKRDRRASPFASGFAKATPDGKASGNETLAMTEKLMYTPIPIFPPSRGKGINNKDEHAVLSKVCTSDRLDFIDKEVKS